MFHGRLCADLIYVALYLVLVSAGKVQAELHVHLNSGCADCAVFKRQVQPDCGEVLATCA
jgi:hypothetical protein